MIGNKRMRGFTLMELVVATGVAGVVVLVAVSSFMLISKGTRREAALERVAEEANAAAERMTRELRAGTINYSAMGNFVNPVSTISFNSSTDGTKRTFTASSDPAVCADAVTPCLAQISLLTGTTLLASKKIKVDYLWFYIQPVLGPGGQAQVVTFILALSDTNATNPASFRIQNTVTLRNYDKQ